MEGMAEPTICASEGNYGLHQRLRPIFDYHELRMKKD